MRPSVVVHLPHASTTLPLDLSPPLSLTPLEIDAELLAMTDRYTDELFALPHALATTVRFPVSRLVVDPERFPDDELEVMAAHGMGVVYTRTSDGHPLRPIPTPAERAALLARFYEPHHRALTAAVAESLSARARCLVLDGHSFPSRPLPYELDQRDDRPDVCIGTDAFHTPSWLRELAAAAFERADFSVAIDRPFAGALVPAAYYAGEVRVAALMVEINRALYMDERTGERLASFTEFRQRLSDVLTHICEHFSSQPA